MTRVFTCVVRATERQSTVFGNNDGGDWQLIVCKEGRVCAHRDRDREPERHPSTMLSTHHIIIEASPTVSREEQARVARLTSQIGDQQRQCSALQQRIEQAKRRELKGRQMFGGDSPYYAPFDATAVTPLRKAYDYGSDGRTASRPARQHHQRQKQGGRRTVRDHQRLRERQHQPDHPHRHRDRHHRHPARSTSSSSLRTTSRSSRKSPPPVTHRGANHHRRRARGPNQLAEKKNNNNKKKKNKTQKHAKRAGSIARVNGSHHRLGRRGGGRDFDDCLLYTSPSPRDRG